MAEYENVLIKKTFDNNFFNVDNVSNSFKDSSNSKSNTNSVPKSGEVGIESIDLDRLSGSQDAAKNSNYISKDNIIYESYLKNKEKLKYQIQSDNKTVLISDENDTPLWWTTIDTIKKFNNNESSNNNDSSVKKESSEKSDTSTNKVITGNSGNIKAKQIDFSKVYSSRSDIKSGVSINEKDVSFEFYIKNNSELTYDKMSDGTLLISDKNGTPLWWTTVDAINDYVSKPQNNSSNSNTSSSKPDNVKPSKEDKQDKKDTREYGSFPSERLNAYVQYGDWGYFGSCPMASSGCGPTSIAIALSSVMNDKNITPSVVADYMVSKGADGGNGTDYTKIIPTMNHYIKENGGNYYTKAIDDLDELKRVLASGNAIAVTNQSTKRGYPLQLSNGETMFYPDGHYFTLTGVKDNGSSNDYDVIISDPAKESNNGAWISVNQIAKNNGNAKEPSFWVVSSEPFD